MADSTGFNITWRTGLLEEEKRGDSDHYDQNDRNYCRIHLLFQKLSPPLRYSVSMHATP